MLEIPIKLLKKPSKRKITWSVIQEKVIKAKIGQYWTLQLKWTAPCSDKATKDPNKEAQMWSIEWRHESLNLIDHWSIDAITWEPQKCSGKKDQNKES